MDNYDLTESRNNLVAKDNRMIQNSLWSLNLLENKAILYLISKVMPDDEAGKIYVFNCREFQALLKWNKAASYQNIKIMLQNLGNVSWWIEGNVQGRKKDILIRWFDIVRMDPGSGDIEISFHRDMFPYILDLQKHLEENGHYYTTYKLQNVTLMKHRYSPRIYELLKSYQYNNKKWTFENGTGTEYDIQRRIADTLIDRKTGKPVSIIPEGWRNWAIFRRDVLEPAVEEINKYSDIKVAYVGKKEDIHHRKTRAIRTVVFYMAGKTAPEQRITDNLIDEEYHIGSDDIEKNRLSVEERFFQEHEKSLNAEKVEREYFEAIQWEKKVATAQYPMLYEELNGESRQANFDSEKIKQLFNTAINGRVVGKIPRMQWERYAVDFITYYYDKIMSTPENTKTTVYNRLLDCVKNDYDQEAYSILEHYTKSEKEG